MGDFFWFFSEDIVLNISARAFRWCIAQIKIRDTQFLVAILRRCPVLDLRAEAAAIGPRAYRARYIFAGLYSGVLHWSLMLPN